MLEAGALDLDIVLNRISDGNICSVFTVTVRFLAGRLVTNATGVNLKIFSLEKLVIPPEKTDQEPW